jgi:hypothetical protein
MDDWALKQYDGMPLHHVPQEHRRALERARQARHRREVAAGMGHPEWADLPPSAEAARIVRSLHWFAVERCAKLHIAPRVMATGECQACLDEPPPEEVRWLEDFRALANRMIETGRVHSF